jgi:predicted secreted hydrolase
MVMRKPAVSLPQDEGPHDLPVEWWYWTAHLQDMRHRAYAIMCVLFKAGIPRLKDVYFAHWFISDIKRQTFAPHLHVFWKGLDPQSFKQELLDVRADHTLSMQHRADGGFHVKTPIMDLTFRPLKPALLIGKDGLVDLKTTHTFYYSWPRSAVQGTLRIKDRTLRVKGLGWMDHQWSPVTFDREHVWTWFSMHLSDGTDLQCFEYGRTRLTRLATISWPDGRQQTCRKLELRPLGDTWTSHRSKVTYDLSWEIAIPEADIHLVCRPKIEKQEIIHGPFRYWEGPTTIEGTVHGQIVSGNGFLELNGVASRSSFIRQIYGLARQEHVRSVRRPG